MHSKHSPVRHVPGVWPSGSVQLVPSGAFVYAHVAGSVVLVRVQNASLRQPPRRSVQLRFAHASTQVAAQLGQPKSIDAYVHAPVAAEQAPMLE
jgi:hypothetical protein